MKKRIFGLSALALALVTAFGSVSAFAYNDDLDENAGRNYAFNQFFLDHFAGCANGDVTYLSNYPCPPGNTTTPLASAAPKDRMRYIADNNWIPIAAYSSKTNIMNFYFAGEQNLDYGQADIIQLNTSCANKPLAAFVSGHSKSDIKALSDMSKAAGSFDFYLNYMPDYVLPGISGAQAADGHTVSPVYENFGDYINLFESKQINVIVGAGAVLKLKAPVKLDTLILKADSVLDLSGLKVNDLPNFNSLNKITSNGAEIIFPSGASAKDREKFLKKVTGTYRVG